MMGGTTIQYVSIIMEQLIHIEQFKKSHVHHVISYDFFCEQNGSCAVRNDFYDLCSAQKIYNVVAMIKKNRMQGYNILLLEAVGMTLTGNEQDGKVHEPFMINTDRESDLKPVTEKVVSRAYHMLCKRHIAQNVLAKLTEMRKDEEVASRFRLPTMLRVNIRPEAMAFNMPW
ncbi:hypothetical protein M9H77_02549 [Catharanthus roseus]|uniref:Uncharacterized protein n=1 Tax=Catharanthus roseus TaxID=4058 RepID=A0ACC0C8P9_CATRO|nr:hypothetical protein M9H77_02549 [Catharanthus roseus]